MKQVNFEDLLASIPKQDLKLIADGAARYLPAPDEEDDNEQAFPVDIDLTQTT